VPITEDAAARIRERREEKIAFRYSFLVDDDDPADKPVGILREWDSTESKFVYAETYRRDRGWNPSDIRQNIERGSNLWARLVPADEAAVRRYIESGKEAQ